MAYSTPLDSWAQAKEHIFVINGRVHPFDSDALRGELEAAIAAGGFEQRMGKPLRTYCSRRFFPATGVIANYVLVGRRPGGLGW
jgi:hypothetical protein